MKTMFCPVRLITLASLVAASLLTHPQALAQGLRPAPPLTQQRPAATFALADGRLAEIANGSLLIMDSSGRANAAPAGEYRTREGRVLHVAVGGMIVAAPANPPAREPMPVRPAIAEPVEVRKPAPVRPVVVEAPPQTKPAPVPTPGGTAIIVTPRRTPGMNTKKDGGNGGSGKSTPGFGVNVPPDSSGIPPLLHANIRQPPPTVQTQLSIYTNIPASPAGYNEVQGATPAVAASVVLTQTGQFASKKDTFQLGWKPTFPVWVKKGRWEVGVTDSVGTPEWKSKPLAGSGEVNFTPQKTDGWSLFTIDLSGISFSYLATHAPYNHFVVRITPLLAGGSPAGPPSSDVSLLGPGWLPPIGLPSNPGKQAPPPTANIPTITADHYTPAANLNLANGENTNSEYGPLLHMKVTRAPSGLTEPVIAAAYGLKQPQPGDTFVINLSPPSQDTSPDLIDIFTEPFKLIEKGIDFASDEYKALKNDLVSVVGAVVQNHALAEALVDVAMSSCGIPPTLPNVEDLQNQGLDYIVDCAAEEAGLPAPPDGLGAQLKQALPQMNQKVSAQANAQYAGLFYEPDPAYFYNPPVLYLRATYSPVATASSASGNTGGSLPSGDIKTPKGDKPDLGNDKLKDSTIKGDDSVPGGKQYPNGNPKPPLPHGDGQNVGEPQTGGGSNAPAKSDAYEFDVVVTAHLDAKTLAYGQFGNSNEVANPVVYVARVHVPPMRNGEPPIIIPVILHLGPFATSADVFQRKSWFAGWDQTQCDFNPPGGGMKPLHKPWSNSKASPTK